MNAYLNSQAVILIACALIGMLCHVAKKAMRGELGVASTNPFQIQFYILLFKYLFVQNPGSSGAAVLTMLAACFGVIGIGQIEAMPVNVIAALGFTTGWAANSAMNKGGE